MMKGVIHDADGTLLDSMHIWNELGQRYLAKHNIKAETGLSELLYPMSLEESGRYLKQIYCLPDHTETIISELLEMIRFFYRYEVVPKTGVIDYLRYLHKRDIPMIITTSNDKALLRSAFARLQIDGYFQDILTCSELNTNKCEPNIYLSAQQMLGTQPCETVVFEDMPQGIRSVKKAGFITVAVADNSNGSKREEIRKISDYYIYDFTDPILFTL